MADVQVYKKSPAEFNLDQRRARKSMRGQIMMFSLMIFLTIMSFSMVMAYQADVIGFSKYLIIPTLMLFAAVQVGLQLYYFMHMNEKGHGIPTNVHVYRSYSCIRVVLTFVTIIWW